MNTRQFLKHRYLHAPAKSATAEGTELRPSNLIPIAALIQSIEDELA